MLNRHIITVTDLTNILSYLIPGRGDTPGNWWARATWFYVYFGGNHCRDTGVTTAPKRFDSY